MFSNIKIDLKKKHYKINLRNKEDYKILLIQEKKNENIKLFFLKQENVIKIENKSPHFLIDEIKEIYEHSLENKSLKYLLKCIKEG